MNNPTYRKAYRVWLMKTRRKIGCIGAGSYVTNLRASRRSDPVFADWLANNGVPRSAVRIVPAFECDARSQIHESHSWAIPSS